MASVPPSPSPRSRSRRVRRASIAVALTLLAVIGSACGGSSAASTTHPGAVTLRLGYFPNLTHAAAVAGVETGRFARALAPDTFQARTFNAGPAAVEALFSGALDAAYLGPSPTINAFVRSHGDAVRVVAGATSGGAALVVRPTIHTAADLAGTRIATPQLGGTQDVALRYWLRQHGLHADRQGGGDVSIIPQENAQTLATMRAGQIDGAWVPEPWATRLVQEAGAKVLVDEASLWPRGAFVTTQLVVRRTFLAQHADTVRRLLEAHLDSTLYVRSDPNAAAVVNEGIARVTGKHMPASEVMAAWSHLRFSADPIATSLIADAVHAEAIGAIPHARIDGLYDLTILNALLASQGLAPVSGP